MTTKTLFIELTDQELRIEKCEKGAVVEIWLRPRSSCTELVGVIDGALKLKVKSPPVEGKANRECLQYLASIFSCAPSSLAVLKGKKGRHKKVLIPLPAKVVREAVNQLLSRSE